MVRVLEIYCGANQFFCRGPLSDKTTAERFSGENGIPVELKSAQLHNKFSLSFLPPQKEYDTRLRLATLGNRL